MDAIPKGCSKTHSNKKMEQTTIYLIIWLMQLLVITSLWYSVAKSEGTFEYFAEKIEECIGLEAEVELDYNNLETFKYYCKKNDIYIKDYEYSEKIICKIQLEECNKERLIDDFNTKKVNLINLKFLSKKLIDKSIIK